MSKRTPSENLKSFSIIYIILAVLCVAAVALCWIIPDIASGLKANLGENILISFSLSAAVSIIFYLWYFWLARRVADGKSNGTLYMILLLVGIISAIVNFFVTKNFTFLTIDTITDIIGLCLLLQVRKEK